MENTTADQLVQVRISIKNTEELRLRYVVGSFTDRRLAALLTKLQDAEAALVASK